jgi:hypothetical protein
MYAVGGLGCSQNNEKRHSIKHFFTGLERRVRVRPAMSRQDSLAGCYPCSHTSGRGMRRVATYKGEPHLFSSRLSVAAG